MSVSIRTCKKGVYVKCVIIKYMSLDFQCEIYEYIRNM